MVNVSKMDLVIITLNGMFSIFPSVPYHLSFPVFPGVFYTSTPSTQREASLFCSHFMHMNHCAVFWNPEFPVISAIYKVTANPEC